jgi:hypothetical protein
MTLTKRQQDILASIQAIPAGQTAIQIASNQILNALGEKPGDLLRAKAAQFLEMADMLDACNEGQADDGAFGETNTDTDTDTDTGKNPPKVT